MIIINTALTILIMIVIMNVDYMIKTKRIEKHLPKELTQGTKLDSQL